MALPSTGYSISVAALNTALSDMLSKWGNDTYPPNYLFADGHYLSLAETFQVMADALAELDHTGKLPQTVKVARIYGPVTMVQGHGPNVGDVSVSSIAKKCSEIDPRLHDDSADPIPMNTVPAGVEVDGIAMNSAQFLRLMAQAMVNPSPETRLRVRMTYMYSAVVQAFPKVRPLEDTGAIWTFKPAPLEAP
jgi:prepilin-type processing-associated H-X9-DG protein